ELFQLCHLGLEGGPAFGQAGQFCQRRRAVSVELVALLSALLLEFRLHLLGIGVCCRHDRGCFCSRLLEELVCVPGGDFEQPGGCYGVVSNADVMLVRCHGSPYKLVHATALTREQTMRRAAAAAGIAATWRVSKTGSCVTLA
ncbi:hypothetical protein EFL26_08480, partial [Nocardioides pocheonensis]